MRRARKETGWTSESKPVYCFDKIPLPVCFLVYIEDGDPIKLVCTKNDFETETNLNLSEKRLHTVASTLSTSSCPNPDASNVGCTLSNSGSSNTQQTPLSGTLRKEWSENWKWFTKLEGRGFERWAENCEVVCQWVDLCFEFWCSWIAFENMLPCVRGNNNQKSFINYQGQFFQAQKHFRSFKFNKSMKEQEWIAGCTVFSEGVCSIEKSVSLDFRFRFEAGIRFQLYNRVPQSLFVA